MTKCLIIDDCRLIREMAGDVLRDHGFDIHFAATGEEALQKMQKVAPDVVLLDMVLPDIPGAELLSLLAEQDNDCRIIVITAHSSLDSALNILRSGAADYLPKPFQLGDLLMCVERVVRRQQLERENQELSLLLQQRVLDLDRSRQELADWSLQLEQTVQDRTQDLHRANAKLKTTNAELEESHQKLQQAQVAMVEREKMAAVALLAAGVAHEVNNPLGFVNANISTLEQYVLVLRRWAAALLRVGDSYARLDRQQFDKFLADTVQCIKQDSLDDIIDDIGPLFEEVSNGLTRITGIVEQLKVFADDGNDARSVKAMDLNQEVALIMELVQSSLAKTLQVEFDLGEISPVLVPVKIFRQILLSILSFHAADASCTRKLVVRTSATQEQVVLDMIDPDCRMSAQSLAEIFDPLFAPKDVRNIGGLGLCAARDSARTIGGSLRMFKRSDGGVSFQLRLPSNAEASKNTRRGEIENQLPITKSARAEDKLDSDCGRRDTHSVGPETSLA